MNRIILIVVIIFVFLLIVFLAWKFLLPNIFNNSKNPDLNKLATKEEIEALFLKDAGSVVGQSVYIDKNKVYSIISDGYYWIGPLGGTQTQILSTDKDLNKDKIIKVSGIVAKISDIKEEVIDWKLTKGDVQILLKTPVYIKGNSVEILN